jgi:hypothetical protein
MEGSSMNATSKIRFGTSAPIFKEDAENHRRGGSTRRSLLGLVPVWLALPRLAVASTPVAASPSKTMSPDIARALPTPTPIDKGEDKPPRPVRVLDPLDPVAIELARLYDVLRSTHPAEIKAKRALLEHDQLGEEIPGDTSEWKEHCDKRDPLWDEDRNCERLRRTAYFNLMRSVIAAHGGGSSWLSEWYSCGASHRVVRVGDRVYSATAEYDTDWPENECEGDIDDGMLVLSVIDL